MRWEPQRLAHNWPALPQAAVLITEWPHLTIDYMLRLDRLKHVLLENGCADGRSDCDGTQSTDFNLHIYSYLMFQRFRLKSISTDLRNRVVRDN